MSKLKCETDTEEVGDEIREAFPFDAAHDACPVFEHGQWWMVCDICGGLWAVNDGDGPGTSCGFDFEEIEPGDEDFCRGETEGDGHQ